MMDEIHVQYYDSPCGEIVLGSVGEGLWAYYQAKA